MALEFDVRDDFGQILDGLEPVSLVRCGKAESIPVAKAWRYSSATREVDPTGGGVVQCDVVWQLVWDAETDLPRIGDSLVDASNDCWTILSVEQLGAKTRLRCQTRNLRIAFGLDNRLEIQVSVEGNWQTIHTAVPGRIQPDKTTALYDDEEPPTSSTTFRITLGEQIALNHNHRILGSDGAIYQILEYTQAERIDVLPIVKAIRVESVA